MKKVYLVVGDNYTVHEIADELVQANATIRELKRLKGRGELPENTSKKLTIYEARKIDAYEL